MEIKRGCLVVLNMTTNAYYRPEDGGYHCVMNGDVGIVMGGYSHSLCVNFSGRDIYCGSHELLLCTDSNRKLVPLLKRD